MTLNFTLGFRHEDNSQYTIVHMPYKSSLEQNIVGAIDIMIEDETLDMDAEDILHLGADYQDKDTFHIRVRGDIPSTGLVYENNISLRQFKNPLEVTYDSSSLAIDDDTIVKEGDACRLTGCLDFTLMQLKQALERIKNNFFNSSSPLNPSGTINPFYTQPFEGNLTGLRVGDIQQTNLMLSILKHRLEDDCEFYCSRLLMPRNNPQLEYVQ
ncbi:MAG: hypothetical protein WC254_00010 [Candidatus Woesearchaeota archaeon]|jgi:hypothetical protein